MENTFDENHEHLHRGQSDNLAAALRHFVKYQLPLSGNTNHSQLEESTSEPLDPNDIPLTLNIPNNVGSNISKQDPLARFLSGKRRLLNKTIEDIVTLIEEREKIRDRNIYQIDKDICEVHTRMFNLPGQRYQLNPDIEKMYHTLQQQVMRSYGEQRAEAISCWRDVTRLKSDLREPVKELEQEKRKQSLLLGGYQW